MVVGSSPCEELSAPVPQQRAPRGDSKEKGIQWGSHELRWQRHRCDVFAPGCFTAETWCSGCQELG